jgi:hypothetical protein
MTQYISKNADYKGKFNAELTGKGTLKFPNGSSHTGSFLRGEPYGEGKNIDANSGIIREGFFKNCLLHGPGKKIYTDGSVRKGTYKNDKMNGHFTIESIDGEICESDYIDNCQVGKCKITRKNEVVYKGFLKAYTNNESRLLLTDLINKELINRIYLASREEWFQEDQLRMFKVSCIGCRKSDKHKLKKCGKCLMARYCGTECQHQDWTEHQLECSHH